MWGHMGSTLGIALSLMKQRFCWQNQDRENVSSSSFGVGIDQVAVTSWSAFADPVTETH